MIKAQAEFYMSRGLHRNYEAKGDILHLDGDYYNAGSEYRNARRLLLDAGNPEIEDLVRLQEKIVAMESLLLDGYRERTTS